MIYYFFYKIALFLKSINPNVNKYSDPHSTALILISGLFAINIIALLVLLFNYKSIFGYISFDFGILFIIFLILSNLFSQKTLEVIVNKNEVSYRNRSSIYRAIFNLLFIVYLVFSFYLIFNLNNK